ncbi:MAG: hypothetical protein JSW52_11255 [Candidatus Coatesbacteria bacterium]|nr:MAG: hypothetical protein JSW52_11255 [Candidatus Coatesbacteria bacterium]
MKKIYLASAVIILYTVCAVASLVYMDTTELVDNSSLVVTGEVDRIESFYGDDDLIYSRAYVTVDDFVKGDYENYIVEVVYPGGTVGGTGMATSISPRFELGMQVVLFLKQDDAGEYVLTNHAGSKFTVVSDTVVEKGITLDEFVAEIAAAVNR